MRRVLPALLLTLAGCGGDAIVGTWTMPQDLGTIEFRSDGTMTAVMPGLNTSVDGTWERVDATHIRTTSAGNTVTVEVTISGDTMTTREPGGSTNTFTRR